MRCNACPLHDLRTSRRGLTIVELLAATVLAVLLVTAVLSVLKTVTKQATAYNRQPVALAWHARLKQHLTWDLTNSRSIRPIDDGFELSGFAGRDVVSKNAVHCRSIIQYSVSRAGDQHCLMRSEVHPDALSLEHASKELVCLNVGGITIGAANEPSSSVSATKNGDGSPVIDVPEGAIAQQLRITLHEPNGLQVVFAHDFNLR